MKTFNYDALPYEEIVLHYVRGASWRELARCHGCPDHKTLAKHVTRRYPRLDVRNQAQSQRARREREGTARHTAVRRSRRYPVQDDEA